MSERKRLVIFSRYNLADQYDLAAEFKGMLHELASRNDVLHLSLKGPGHVDPPANVTIEELPVTIDRSSARNILWQSLLMYLFLPSAALRIRKFKADGIFLSEILPLVGLFLKWTTGARVSTAYGDWHVHNMLANKWYGKPVMACTEWLDRFEVRRLDGFLCRASAAGERIKQWSQAETNVRVVRDAPDPEAFHPRDRTDLRMSCGFREKDTVLLYHGIMHAGKGLDKLIRWVNELYQENPDIGLMLVGSGPEEQALREQAAELPIKDRVYFTGWLKTIKEVGDYCCAADINIAMRTKAEANDRVVPGALLHSMACRKVVIGPDLSGIAEILEHGQNGFMFKADDGDSFKALIRELIEKRDTWDHYGERAYRDIQQNYSVKAAEKKYAEALEHFAVNTVQ